LLGLKAHDAFKSVDLLRFIASVGIIARHSIEFLVPAEQRQSLNDQTAGLALFVDLFFMLSGFIIAMVYLERVGTLGGYAEFLKKRIARLYPLHLLTLVAAMLLSAGLLAVGISQNHPPSWSAQCIGETALLIHAVIDCGGISFNPVNWSISAEMLLYVLFPLAAMAALRWPTSLLLGWIGLLAWAGLSAASNETGAWTDLYAPLRAAPSFVFGMLLFVHRERIAAFVPAGLFWPVAGALLVSMVIGAPWFVSLALCHLAVASAISMDLRGKTDPVVRALAPLGELTYSIYMTHWLIILVIMNGIADKLLHLDGPAMWVAAACCYSAIFVASILSYRLYEGPSRRLIDRRFVFAPKANPTTAA